MQHIEWEIVFVLWRPAAVFSACSFVLIEMPTALPHCLRQNNFSLLLNLQNTISDQFAA